MAYRTVLAALALFVATAVAPTAASSATFAGELNRGDAPTQARGFAAALEAVAPGRSVPLRLEMDTPGDPWALNLASARLVLDYQPIAHGSEGIETMGIPQWQSLGLTGAGVKVAVVDIGFGGYEARLGTTLPATVSTKTYLGDGTMGTSPHGTAVAEIVTAVAGGVDLTLVTIAAESDLEPLVDWLIAEGIDVVNASIGFTVGPFDGVSSPVSRAVARAVDAGIVWVVSAGNSALTHWGGPITDTDADGWTEIPNLGEINGFQPAPGPVDVDLTWTDTTADLGVCLYDLSGFNPVELVCADMIQQPGDRPVENIRWYADSPAPPMGVAVYSHEPTTTNFDLFVDGAVTLDYPVAAGSIGTPADVDGVITVGAVPWDDPFTLEDFSSRGPTADGRIKPDFVAPDRVSTDTYGPGAFAGTSASSPHVAGLVALYLEAWPGRSPATVAAALAELALPLTSGSTSKSPDSGWGLARAAEIVPVPPGGRFLDDNGNVHEPMIEAVASAAVTQGCATALYCPTEQVSRWQMALFLTRASAFGGAALPDGSDQGFTDIGQLPTDRQLAVNQLAQLGITTGTSATTFDPDGLVTRRQMALFLIRLVALLGTPLPDGSDQGFTDIAALSPEEQLAVNQLAQLGITTGTSATTFDPDGLVLRDQMASFIGRALGLTPLPPPPPVE